LFWEIIKLQQWFNINNVILGVALIIVGVDQTTTHLQVILFGTDHLQTMVATLWG
jgi:hypothetical protein